MDAAADIFISKMNYLIYILLMVMGMYGIFIKKNYLKKIIGLNILQTAIILFFISIGAKKNATLPILEIHSQKDLPQVLHAEHYINPLPHVLMLTAIVVAVATLGAALAIVIKLYREFNTIEEDQILSQLNQSTDDAG